MIWEDPACGGTTKPMRHQLYSLCSRGQKLPQLKPECPRARDLEQEKPPQWKAHAPNLESSPHSPLLEKSQRSKEDPA